MVLTNVLSQYKYNYPHRPHATARNRTPRAVEFMRVVADNALYNRKTKRDELFEDFLENGNPPLQTTPQALFITNVGDRF